MHNISEICNIYCGNNNSNVNKIYSDCQNKFVFDPKNNFECWKYKLMIGIKMYICKTCHSLMCRYCISRDNKKCVNCSEKNIEYEPRKERICVECNNHTMGSACQFCGKFVEFCDYDCDIYMQKYNLHSEIVCSEKCLIKLKIMQSKKK